MHEPRPRSAGPVPMPMNVYEDGDALVVEACLPGVAPDDVELSSQDGVLTIRARGRVARREYLHQEIHDVEYLRRISLPAVKMRLLRARHEFRRRYEEEPQ